MTILYRDIRTYSTKEKVYRQARQKGVRFIRFEPEEKPLVQAVGSGLEVSVFDQGLRERLIIPADRLVLSAAVRPNPEAHRVASKLKLPLDADGFFMEAHLKLRPVDFAAQGFFLAGLAHGPKFIEESVAQAKGAAGRAAAVLGPGRAPGGRGGLGHRSGALRPLPDLPADLPLRRAPSSGPTTSRPSIRRPARDAEAASRPVPRQAITLGHHTDGQILAKEMALAVMTDNGFNPKILALVCTYCTYTAADMAGSMRLQYPPNVRVVKLLCTGRVDINHLLEAFLAGWDAVMVSGCEIGDCHFLEGNLRAKERVAHAKTLIEEAGLEPERLEMFHIGASDAPKWAETVTMMTERTRELGPNPLRRT